MTRAFRRALAHLLIGVSLFVQFAVASYACPGLRGAVPVASAVAGTALAGELAQQPRAMPPGCDQMDPQAAPLCAEHCKQGQQSADTAAPVLHPGGLSLMYPLPLEAQHVLGSGAVPAAPAARLAAAPEPPHAILHCVFRI